MEHSRQAALAAWRLARAQGTEETLPSGLPVTLRRVELLDLVGSGAVPAPLLGAVEKLSNATTIDVRMEQFQEFVGVINLVCKSALAEPPVADVADDEHLGVDELPMSDRLWVFNWAQRPAAKVESFRPEEGKPVADS